MGTETIYNYRKAAADVITGGQPTAAELHAAAGEGVRTIINLAPLEPRYSLDDEAGIVEALGIAYYHLPVAWDNPTEADFAAFEQVMSVRPSGTTLIHCAANFRVSAFYALYARKHAGWSLEQAEAFRAAIWDGSDYPIWETFIGRMHALISAQEQRAAT